MKKIEAIIPHPRLDSTFSALEELELGGFTYYESKGRGELAPPEIHAGRGTSVYRPEFNANVTVSIVVRDDMVKKVTDKILETTSTGLAGEGKIFVSDINEVVDIGSKNRGDSAL